MDDDLGEVVLLVPAVIPPRGAVPAVVNLVRRVVLPGHELALGAEAVLPGGGLLHAAADREGLGQEENGDGPQG